MLHTQIMQKLHTKLAGLEKEVVKAAVIALLCTTCLLLASFDTDSTRQLTSSSAVPLNEMQITAIIQALNAKLHLPSKGSQLFCISPH